LVTTALKAHHQLSLALQAITVIENSYPSQQGYVKLGIIALVEHQVLPLLMVTLEIFVQLEIIALQTPPCLWHVLQARLATAQEMVTSTIVTCVPQDTIVGTLVRSRQLVFVMLDFIALQGKVFHPHLTIFVLEVTIVLLARLRL